jgi:hypothetical protein
MNTYLRLLVCVIAGTIAVFVTAWIQISAGSQSSAQLMGVGMITLVLAWVATGMKMS